MSKPKRKTLGERVAEKWLPEESKYRIELSRLIDREVKKLEQECTLNAAVKWGAAFEAAAIREARASCALDGETQSDPNHIPKPKKVRRRK